LANWRLTIDDCRLGDWRLAIVDLATGDWRLGRLGDLGFWAAAFSCTIERRRCSRPPNRQSPFNRQSAIGNRQSAIGNRQSKSTIRNLNRQSSIDQIRSPQSAIRNR
jgi:hypothetical protein